MIFGKNSAVFENVLTDESVNFLAYAQKDYLHLVLIHLKYTDFKITWTERTRDLKKKNGSSKSPDVYKIYAVDQANLGKILADYSNPDKMHLIFSGSHYVKPAWRSDQIISVPKDKIAFIEFN